jgi:molybdopterin biosynthesis enzyme
MMTQLSTSPQKSTTVADFTLTADIRNPDQNRAYTRARAMAPDELYSAGYRHGSKRQGMLGSMSHSADYRQGWLAGDKDRRFPTGN